MVLSDEETPRLNWAQAAQKAVENAASVVVTDGEGTILDASPAFCRLTGYSISSIVGRNERELASGRHTHSFWTERASVLRAGKVWRGRVFVRAETGKLIVQDTVDIPSTDASGAVVHVVSMRFESSRSAARLDGAPSPRTLPGRLEGPADAHFALDLEAQTLELSGGPCADSATGQEIAERSPLV